MQTETHHACHAICFPKELLYAMTGERAFFKQNPKVAVDNNTYLVIYSKFVKAKCLTTSERPYLIT